MWLWLLLAGCGAEPDLEWNAPTPFFEGEPTITQLDWGCDLDEMEWVEEDGMYYYQCPCGDMFEISQEDIEKGEDVARCPSCSLTLKVIMPAAGKDAVTTTPAQTTAIAAG